MTEPTPDAASDADVVPHEDTSGRQCARCRHHFPVEAGTDPIELIGWWACPDCTAALLPSRSRTITS